MKMELQQFLDAVASTPEKIEFETTIAVIEANYEFTPTAFTNGATENRAGENNGSCKIFAFGLLNNLDKEATLACFGRFYREDVLQHPENDDHQNIRNFMVSGWDGVKFESLALKAK
ncbi:type III effector [Vibrio natriegens NBRC 15636 = ATCC 14048 = DSM 759]|uniref:Type III effector n=2 Tax=Vibrio natriegens TaxID=691 RepID=A0AAN0Y6N6_VIBNA|nr:type III effector [Vibrio natriegens NBRC 15636 = ATCC 14048 = DSM 759]ANQ14628.1 type III effector [Vibrio natriegens NBRC 15636 = ATCC 14048 = DSM 759]